VSLAQLFDLKGRVALVTGGSRGLGLQMAEVLGEMGARVAISARKREELDAAVAHLGSQGIEAHAMPCDMSDAAAIGPMVGGVIDKLGPVDILVNNAGTTWGAATVDHPLEAWKKVLDLNLTSMLGMVGTADTTRPGTIGYAASKGGVISFTRSLAAEWAQYDINVNAIAPGLFPTKMTKGLIELMGDRAATKAPLNRVGGPEDLKGITALFASDACAFITGQVIAVDGGATAV
jgi:NAD(P)-dependent dehydrogenase (short-subunit alcohol dehydrogenase family)